jgi:hypothetical protein
MRRTITKSSSLFGWLVADGWCWFVLREEYCWLIAGGWFVLREKYWWLVADKPSEQGVGQKGIMLDTKSNFNKSLISNMIPPIAASSKLLE